MFALKQLKHQDAKIDEPVINLKEIMTLPLFKDRSEEAKAAIEEKLKELKEKID